MVKIQQVPYSDIPLRNPDIPVRCMANETLTFEPMSHEIHKGETFTGKLIGTTHTKIPVCAFFEIPGLGVYPIGAPLVNVEVLLQQCPLCKKHYSPSYPMTHFCDYDDTQLANKFKTELARVIYHNHRAKEHGLPATLTLRQWIATLDYFEWKCVYCKGKYSVLEHFVPLGYEEGTTWANCVPSCRKCNSAKGPYHPKTFSPSLLEKWHWSLPIVQQYLETRRSEEVTI